MVFDWLAAGLDPEKSRPSSSSRTCPQHAELHLLLSMITPLGWLERVPTYKEQRENIKEKDLGTYGFLGYPVLQSADILMYKANYVPVGEDQVPHVEITREIARRFNMFYSGSHEVVSSRSRSRCLRRCRNCPAPMDARCRSPTATPFCSAIRSRWSGRS